MNFIKQSILLFTFLVISFNGFAQDKQAFTINGKTEGMTGLLWLNYWGGKWQIY